MKEKREVWKAVVGYEGMYEVSNLGRVKSLDRKRFNGRVMANKKGQVMQTYVLKNGYCSIRLCKDGKVKNHLIHRLVAMSFLPNPNNLEQVNHKDENKLNNCVDNLEWCDRLYNNNYGTTKQRNSKSKKENPPKATMYEFNGETHCLKEWAQIKNVSYEKVKKRWNKGLRGEELFSKDDYNKVRYEFLGRNYTLKEWSVCVGMEYQLLYSRWKRGKRGYELFRGYEDVLPQ